MQDQKFTIQNLLFDIGFSSREKTHELQNRISRLFTNSLSSSIENFFNETIPAEVIVKFDVLTLDLGTVEYNNLENEIADKLVEAIRKAFPHSLKSGASTGQTLTTYSIEPSRAGYLELLEYFLLTGFFPWWATTNAVVQLQKHLLELLDDRADELRQILLSTGQKEYVRKRLVYQFSESFVHQIIYLLEPADAPFILNYQTSVKVAHMQSPLIKSASDEFNREVLVFILTFLIVEKESDFSRKEFIKSTLKQIAAHFSVKYAEVLSLFEQVLDSNAIFIERLELTRLLQQISADNNANYSSNDLTNTYSSPIVSKQQEPAVEIQWLQYFFEHGRLPLQLGTKSSLKLKEILHGLIDQAPADLIHMLTAFGGDLILERIFRFGDKETVKKLIQLLHPSRSNELLLYANALEEVLLKILHHESISAQQYVLTILINFAVVGSANNSKAFIYYAIDRLSKISGEKQSTIYNLFLAKLGSNLLFADLLTLIKFGESEERNFLNLFVERDHVVKKDQPATISASIFHSQDIDSLLRHFIITGTLPWWSIQSGISIKKALNDLYELSPGKARELFQWAGTQKRYRERFLLQFPISALLKIMSEFTAGDVAVIAFQRIMASMEKPGSYSKGKMSSIELIVIRVIWEQLIAENYQSFNENFFYVQSAFQIAAFFNIYPDDIMPSIWELFSSNDTDGFARALHVTASGVRRSSSIKAISYEVLVTSLGDFFAAHLEEDPSDIGREKILAEILSDVEYFFINHSFPNSLKQRVGFSSFVYLKSALLALYEWNINRLQSSLVKYLQQPWLPVLLQRLFSMDKADDRPFLQFLCKLSYKQYLHSVIHASYTYLENEGGSPLSDERELVGKIPLIRRHYLGSNQQTPEQLFASVQQTLDFFLTWNELPDPLEPFGKEIENDMLKEVVIFMFDFNRAGLISILQKETHFSRSGLRLYDLFKTKSGGKESLIAIFLGPFQKAALLDYLWEADMPTFREVASDQHTLSPGPDNKINNLPAVEEIVKSEDLDEKHPEVIKEDVAIFQSLDALINRDEGLAERAGNLLNYYLTSGKLPDGFRISSSELSQFITRIIRIVFFHKKEVLENILQRQTHNADARIQMHEWFFSGGYVFDKPLLELVNQFLIKDLFLYFSKHTETTAPASIRELLDNISTLTDSNKKRSFLQAAVSYQIIPEYIARQYDDPAFYKFLETFDSPWSREANEIGKELQRFIYPVLNSNYEQYLLNNFLKEFSLLIVAERITVRDRFDFVRSFFDYLDQQRPLIFPHLYEDLHRSMIQTDFIVPDNPLQRHLQTEVLIRKTPLPEEAKIKIEKKSKVKTPVLIQKNASNQILRQESNNEDKANETNAVSKIEKGTKLYVLNAGLVLLHPFISTYFSLTGLVAEGKFIDEAAQHRAVHLLQFMVYGSAEHEEQALVLNKILCGLPLEEPVPQVIDLTDKEKAVTADLFKILFQRWEKMKNSSVEGFRHSFLQREGVLLKSDESWTMQVQQKGYDMLLQTLPWAYGLIKLPWMPQVLQVDWM